MKTFLFIARTMAKVIFIVLSLFGCKDESVNPEGLNQFSLYSASSNTTYPIRVALPTGYDPVRTYKTVYVLDSEENFGFVTNRCEELSEDLSVNNVIVVGIGWGNSRNLDYTPTTTGPGTGGATQFMEFISNQLIPEVENRFKVDTTRNGRVILGHSYGGLLGVFAFAKYNDVFGNYILLSPSIWFDDEVTLEYEKENRELNSTHQQLVFLGQGELENSGRMQAPFEALYQILTRNYSNAKIAKHLERGLTHVASKNPNIVHGLRFYFENQSR